MAPTYTGHAACGNCHWYYDGFPLTGAHRSADDGGEWWTVAPNTLCPGCGVTMTEMHVPAPNQLVLTLVEELTMPPEPFEPGIYTTAELRRIYGQDIADAMIATGRFISVPGRADDVWQLAPDSNQPPAETDYNRD